MSLFLLLTKMMEQMKGASHSSLKAMNAIMVLLIIYADASFEMSSVSASTGVL